MNGESTYQSNKWRDARELWRRASQFYVEPIAYDILARIVPGLILLLGVLVVTKGVGLTWELVAVLSNWFSVLVTLFFAWLLGLQLTVGARAVWYGKPLQPEGWRKYLWLEAVNDFEERAPLALRRAAGRARIISHGSLAIGAAFNLLLVVAVVAQNTPPAWAVLILAILVGVTFAIHIKLGIRLALSVTVILGVVLLIVAYQLDPYWASTVLFLLAGILVLRIIHKVFRGKWHSLILKVVNQQTVQTAGQVKPIYLGEQGIDRDDHASSRSKYEDVYNSAQANPYYNVWGIGGQKLPTYRVTLKSVLRGILPWGLPYQFKEAAIRTVESRAILRPGPDNRGYRRLLHPNGVCLFGKWVIDDNLDLPYTGYFKPGKEALLVARYSTCCTETRRGRSRSLSLVGKLYPTLKKDEEVPTANFITQQDIGGDKNQFINEAVLLNAPNTTVWRRGFSWNGLPVILITGLLFKLVDKEPAIRQLYEIAELGEDGPSRTPKFMRLKIPDAQPKIPGMDLDFRDEVLAQIYDPGHPEKKRQLVFEIEVSDEGKTVGPAFFQRRKITGWKKIGRLVFDEAVASYNGDAVIHFHHPGWRDDRDNSATANRNAARGRSD